MKIPVTAILWIILLFPLSSRADEFVQRKLDKNGALEKLIIKTRPGTVVEGKFGKCFPATVELIEPSGRTNLMKISDLPLGAITNLPDSVSEPYKAIVMQNRIIDDNLKMMERLHTQTSNASVMAEKMVQESLKLSEAEARLARARADVAKQKPPYEVLSFNTKEISTTGGYTYFSWLVQIKNNSSSTIVGTLNVKFYDREKFMVDQGFVSNVSLSSGLTKTFSGQSMAKQGIYKTISSAEAVFD